MSKNIIKSLLSGIHQNIVLGNMLTLKMNKLKKPFDLPTNLSDCNALLRSLQRHERNMIKYWRANQATTVKACEQAFVAMNVKQFEGIEQSKFIFAQKKKKLMWSLPKSKKNGSGSISSVLVPLPTAKEETDWG